MAVVKQSKRVPTDSSKNDLADFIDTSRRDLDAQIGSSAVGAALTLAIVAVPAGWLPAWRASRIDPAKVGETDEPSRGRIGRSDGSLDEVLDRGAGLDVT
jgi:hypothetical protein